MGYMVRAVNATRYLNGTRAAALAIGTFAAFTGCANEAYATCDAESITPLVQLLYPEPGATGVPADVGILVYGAFPNIATTAETPIELQVAGAPPIATQPTAVPNPLPSPAATASAAPLAVSVPALAAATTYQVYARQTIGGCVTPHNVETNVGSFTTK